MTNSTASHVVDRVIAAIRDHPAVLEVTIVGSRSDGSAGPLSDWDFRIDASDAHQLFEDLPELVSGFEPLVAFWDPLGDRRNFMAIFPGLLKLDLHLDLPPQPHVPWEIDRDTLAAVDNHFWDWTLWLAGKSLRGYSTLVSDELVKMHRYLLEPLGCDVVPQTLADAVARYLEARETAEAAHGPHVSGNPLETEVRAALERHKLFSC